MTADTPLPPAESPQNDYDSPWKEALERFFPEFLALLFPAIHSRIDWRVAPAFLDKELQQIGADSPHGRRYADKLVRVQALDGQEIAVLIHVEVQGDPERDFGERMFVYQTRLRDRYGLDVVSLAVLTDTTASFRPGQFRHRRWGCGIAFRFPMVKLPITWRRNVGPSWKRAIMSSPWWSWHRSAPRSPPRLRRSRAGNSASSA